MKQQGRRARLVVAGGVWSAAVLGCGHPVIAVAPALVKRLGPDELDRIVIHEWAHVQRRDDLLNVFQLLARSLAGWHPAVWWLNRQLQIEREAACDEIAVAVTGSSKGYASSLATLAGLSPLRSQAISSLGVLSAPMLGRRIVRILSQKNLASPIWSARAAVAAASSLCVLSVTIAECQIVGASSYVPRVEDSQPAAAQSHAVSPSGLSTLKTQTAATRSDEGQVIREQTAPGPQTPADSPVSRPEVQPQATESRAPGTTASPQTIAVEPLRPLDSEGARTSQVPDIRVAAPARMIAVPGSPRPTDAVVTPWGAAADAGVAVGRRSQDAAAATAGAFSRLGKKIAASF